MLLFSLRKKRVPDFYSTVYVTLHKSSIGYDGIGAFSEIATKKLRQEIEPKNCDKK